MSPTWTDIGSFAVLAAQLVVLVVAAVVGYRQVGEARRLREEQTRPIVVLDFSTENALFFLTLSNLGTTMARNVKIAVTPPLASALDDQTERIAALQMFGEQGIPTLAPGKHIRTLFDVAFQRKPETGLPDVYVARITYDDHALERRFHEEITLDLGVYWGLQRVERDDLTKSMRGSKNSSRPWIVGLQTAAVCSACRLTRWMLVTRRGVQSAKNVAKRGRRKPSCLLPTTPR